MGSALSSIPVFSHLIESPVFVEGRREGAQMSPESHQAPAAGDGRPASSPAEFRVHPERVDGVYRLSVSGELDLATRDTLIDELKRAEASEAKCIQLDLNDLTFIDSSGIAVLVLAHQRTAMNGTQLRVLSAGGQVREVLELTGLTEVLDFTE
jgi:stage II sporulation protein AA (anti-sigma F factor antagonist)